MKRLSLLLAAMMVFMGIVAASAKLAECYNRQKDYGTRLADAKQKQVDMASVVEFATEKYEELKNTLAETDAASIMARQNMKATQQEHAEATAEVQKHTGQEDDLKRSTQNAADAVSTAQTQLNRDNAAVRETGQAIRDTTQQLRKSSPPEHRRARRTLTLANAARSWVSQPIGPSKR